MRNLGVRVEQRIKAYKKAEEMLREALKELYVHLKRVTATSSRTA
ncbi:MAG: hypothetical protein QXU09_02370 [Thermoproteota archaeon]